MTPTMVRRMARKVALELGAVLVGGQRALATVLHVSERSVRGWLGFDRDIGDGVLLDAAEALDAHADKCRRHATAIRTLVAEHLLEKEGQA